MKKQAEKEVENLEASSDSSDDDFEEKQVLSKPYDDSTMESRYQRYIKTLKRHRRICRQTPCDYFSFDSSSSDDSHLSEKLATFIDISKNMISEDDTSGSENELANDVKQECLIDPETPIDVPESQCELLGTVKQEFTVVKVEKAQNSPSIELTSFQSCSSSGKSAGVLISLSDFSEKPKKKRFVCPICNKSLINLRGHIESVHFKMKRFLCYMCTSQFYYRYDLKRHMSSHLWNSRFIPRNIPSKSEKISPFASLHLFACQPIRPFVCDFGSCSKRFFRNFELKKHLQITHCDDRPFICWCAKSFKVKSNLIRHQKEVHSKKHKFAVRNLIVVKKV